MEKRQLKNSTDIYSWKLSFIILSCIYPLGVILVLSINIEDKSSNVKVVENSIIKIIEERVLKPFYDFIIKKNWILILIFIACFKWGDALLGVLSQPFMLEIGFSKSEIAAISKVYGLVATLVGLFVGGYLFGHDGRKMSKSIGNVMDPFELSKQFGSDLVRYYLLRTVPYGNDGNVGSGALIQRCNADLSNAYLNSATLTNANLQNANLFSTDLGGADISNVDFSGADLRQIYIKSSKMENIVTNSDTKMDSCFQTDFIN